MLPCMSLTSLPRLCTAITFGGVKRQGLVRRRRLGVDRGICSRFACRTCTSTTICPRMEWASFESEMDLQQWQYDASTLSLCSSLHPTAAHAPSSTAHPSSCALPYEYNSLTRPSPGCPLEHREVRPPCVNATVEGPPPAPPYLRISRWLHVVHHKYKEERPQYTRHALEWVDRYRRWYDDCARVDITALDAFSLTVEALAHCHSDALLVQLEYIDRTASKRSKEADEELRRCILTLLPQRGVELSSKHVAFCASLLGFNVVGASSGAYPSAAWLAELCYINRGSLRRVQGIVCLQAWLRYPYNTDLPWCRNGLRLYERAMTHLVARLLQDTPSGDSGARCSHVEGYDVEQLVQRVVTFRGDVLDSGVYQAALNWLLRCKRAAAAESLHAGRHLPLYLEETLSTYLPSTAVMAAVRHRSQVTHGFSEAVSDREILTRLKRSKSVVERERDHLGTAPRPSLAHLKDRLERLHAQPAGYLPALREIHDLLLRLPSVMEIAAFAETIPEHAPILATTLLHRLMYLLPLYVQRDISKEDINVVLTAVFRLVGRADILEVVHSLLAVLLLSDASTAESGAVLIHGIQRCISQHVPPSLVTVIIHHVTRSLELSAFRCPLVALQFITALLNRISITDVTEEGKLTVRYFIEQEYRKSILNAEQSSQLDEASNRILQMVSVPNGLIKTDCTVLDSDIRSQPYMAMFVNSHSNLVHLFGAGAHRLVTLEAASTFQAALVWLWQLHTATCSIQYEAVVLHQLARMQGVTLRLSNKRIALVMQSEAHDKSPHAVEPFNALTGRLLSALQDGGGLEVVRGALLNLLEVRGGTTAPILFLLHYLEVAWCGDTTTVAKVADTIESPTHATVPAAVQSDAPGVASGIVISPIADPCDHLRFALEAVSILRWYEDYLHDNWMNRTDILHLLLWVQRARCRSLSEVLTSVVKCDPTSPMLSTAELVVLYRDLLQLLSDTRVQRSPALEEARTYLCTDWCCAVHDFVLHMACSDPDLWRESTALLQYVEDMAPIVGRPSLQGYQTVLRVCLKHRIEAPQFLRERCAGNAADSE